VQVLDKSRIEFVARLRLTPSAQNPKLTVAYVDHPHMAAQRVIIDYKDLRGAVDGSLVRVVCSRQFQNSQQQMLTGKVVEVLPEPQSSLAVAAPEPYEDEFAELSATWSKKGTTKSPAKTPAAAASLSASSSSKEANALDAFVAVDLDAIKFNEYLPPVVITVGSLNIR